MNAFDVIGGILLIVAALVIIFLVVSQQSNDRGMGSIMGENQYDTFFSKTKGRTLDAMLKRWTKVGLIVFMALTLVVNAITIWVK